MRKILIAVAVASTAALAAPAAAQPDYGRGYGYQQGRDIDRQLQNIAANIRRAAERGRITQREANRLMRQVEQIDRLYDRYRRNGLNQGEHRDLQNRIQHLRQRLQMDRRDGRWDDRRWDDDRDRDRRGRRWDRDDDDDDDDNRRGRRWGRDDDDDDDDD